MLEDRLLIPAAIVIAGFLIAVGLFVSGGAIRDGLRCQPVAAIPAADSPIGGGVHRPAGC